MYQPTEVKLVEVETISQNWKRFHVGSLVAAAVFGIVSGTCLSAVFEVNEPSLCGSASLSGPSEAKPFGPFIILNGSYFALTVTAGEGSEGACSFSQYTFISSFIFAVIWTVFFLMCGPGGKSRDGLPQPWRIVPPATIFSCAFFLITIGAGAQVSTAFQKLCMTFDQEMAVIFNITDTSSRYRCQDLNLFASLPGYNIETAIQIAEIAGWLCVSSWACTVAVGVTRLLVGPDFGVLLKSTGGALPISRSQGSSSSNYEELKNASSPSIASSPDVKTSGAITGTSQVEIHILPQTDNGPLEKEIIIGDDVQSDNEMTTADKAIRKKQVRLDPEVRIMSD